jgi:hypothetical protein
MVKILSCLALVLSVAVVSLSGCTGVNIIVGTGDIVSKQYDFKDFNTVEASNSIDVRISAADVYSITVSTHENIIKHLDVSQSGKTLSIKLPQGSFGNTDIKAVITLPTLARLDLSGASNGTMEGFHSANDFELRVSGASQLNIDNMETGKTTVEISGASKVAGHLDTQNTEMTVSGASRCELSGSAIDVIYHVSGASHVNNQDLQIRNADITVGGASKATINVSCILSVDVTGASTLEYHGNPTLKTVLVTGASQLIHQ